MDVVLQDEPLAVIAGQTYLVGGKGVDAVILALNLAKVYMLSDVILHEVVVDALHIVSMLDVELHGVLGGSLASHVVLWIVLDEVAVALCSETHKFLDH